MPDIPLYASMEDRMFGRTQRPMTDEEELDSMMFLEYVGHQQRKSIRRLRRHIRVKLDSFERERVQRESMATRYREHGKT